MALVTKSFSDIITFTRTGTNATYFNSAGVLTSAGADVPRFDFNPSTLAARGLLIEEQRTNLLLQSADFTTTWTQTNVTITANSTASPDGGTNGDTLLINSAGATTSQTSQSFTAGSTITVSTFAKKNASNFVRFEVGGLVNCWFDLNTGVTGTNSAGSGNVLFSAKSIQAISGGWYRCVLTVTTSTITTLGVNIFATNADNTSSSVNSSVFLWGAQAEVGAFPTSYIPTTTTALTRSADVASVNTLAPWYNATAGTLYAEYSIPFALTTSGNASIARLLGSGGTGVNDIALFVNQPSGKNISHNIWTSSTNVGRLDAASAFAANTAIKTAAAFTANDRAVTSSGTAATTSATAFAMPTVTSLFLGSDGNGAQLTNGYLRRITYYPRRLTNAELQALTV